MYDDEPYNEAEQDVIQHVADDIDDVENGRASRRRACVSKGEGDFLDLNISTKATNQKLTRFPLAILSRLFRNLLRVELSGNDLGVSGLPAQFEKCESLYYLKLEYCSLPKIPDVVRYCSCLCSTRSAIVTDTLFRSAVYNLSSSSISGTTKSTICHQACKISRISVCCRCPTTCSESCPLS